MTSKVWALGIGLMLLGGCGSERPSFSEQRGLTTQQSGQAADATGVEQDAVGDAGGAANVASQVANASSQAGDSANQGGVNGAATPGADAGQDQAGSGTQQPGGEPLHIDPTNPSTPPGSGTTDPSDDPSGLDPSQGEIHQVQRVGINFEDLNAAQKSDFDYNDVVLCFTGEFSVQNSNVVSNAAQMVTAQVFSASSCDHRVDVRIVNPEDGTFTVQSFPSKGTGSVSLSFQAGFYLEVSETPVAGACTDTHEMHDAQYAEVLPDVCNLSGN